MAQVKLLDRRSPPLLNAMEALFQQAQKPHHAAHPDHFGPASDRDAILHYLQGFLTPRNPLRKRHGFAYGWYVDDCLSGYLLYWLQQSQDIFYGKPRWICFIEDIVIDEAARGQGGASSLMKALLDEIAPLENCIVSGNVWKGNAASEALFHKHGFEPLSQRFYKVSS